MVIRWSLTVLQISLDYTRLFPKLHLVLLLTNENNNLCSTYVLNSSWKWLLMPNEALFVNVGVFVFIYFFQLDKTCCIKALIKILTTDGVHFSDNIRIDQYTAFFSRVDGAAIFSSLSFCCILLKLINTWDFLKSFCHHCKWK